MKDVYVLLMAYIVKPPPLFLGFLGDVKFSRKKPQKIFIGPKKDDKRISSYQFRKMTSVSVVTSSER